MLLINIFTTLFVKCCQIILMTMSQILKFVYFFCLSHIAVINRYTIWLIPIANILELHMPGKILALKMLNLHLFYKPKIDDIALPMTIALCC